MLDFSVMAPLEPVKLANGRVLPVRPLDAAGWELWRECKTTGSDAKALELVRRILPDATDDDLDTLGDDHAMALVRYAQGKVTVALALVGNSAGAMATASTSPPSPPSPTPSTA